MGMITSNKSPKQTLEELQKAPSYSSIDFVRQVTTRETYQWQVVGGPAPKYHIVVLDCGLKYNILRILRGAGSNGLPCLEIANRMVTREPDITRLLDRIEKSGWIRRSRSTTDRRVVFITITASGLAILGKLDRPIRKLHGQMLGHLTRDDLKEISRLMAKVRNVS